MSKIAILHYTAPPTMGGVEVVIEAHATEMIRAGHDVTLVAGRQETYDVAHPLQAAVHLIPELDSGFPGFQTLSDALNHGQVPATFKQTVHQLAAQLAPVIAPFDHVFVHNVLTKHFNLPFTAAIYALLDAGHIKHLINWCHDLTWGSQNPLTRAKVRPGYPWDLLRLYRDDITYITGSQARREQLIAELRVAGPDHRATDTRIAAENILVIPNGVHAERILGLSAAAVQIIDQIGLLASDLIILMPVRISQAKNIEYALALLHELYQQAPELDIRLVVTGPPDPHNPEDQARFANLRSQRGVLALDGRAHFVYELNAQGAGCLIDMETVSSLYRAADLVFMPSHREGFGIPIVEAALCGAQIVASQHVPAVDEIGAEQVMRFMLHATEAANQAARTQLARTILHWQATNPTHKLKRIARQQFTWEAIYQHYICPLLNAP